MGYSSRIRGWLVVDGHELPLAQVGPGFCILRQAIDIAPSTEAQLIIEVDGDQRDQTILLHAGIAAGSPAVTFHTTQ